MSLIGLMAAAIGSLGDVTPNAVNWADLSGTSPQSNANQTINGCSGSIVLSATNSSSGTLLYSLAGAAFTAYLSPFSVDAAAGQTLRWQVTSAIGTKVGTVTVTNDTDGGATLDTFTYSVSA